MAHPDHQIRLCKAGRLRGAHRIAMRRGAGRQDQLGRAHPLHHLRHQGMHRGDVNGHFRDLCQRGQGKQDGAGQN